MFFFILRALFRRICLGLEHQARGQHQDFFRGSLQQLSYHLFLPRGYFHPFHLPHVVLHHRQLHPQFPEYVDLLELHEELVEGQELEGRERTSHNGQLVLAGEGHAVGQHPDVMGQGKA